MPEFKMTLEMSAFQNCIIPEYMCSGIELYLNQGIRPGDFLTKIFENDFVGAIGKADTNNMQNIPAYANFLYNYVSISCWGSKKTVDAWIKSKRHSKKSSMINPSLRNGTGRIG